MFIGKNCQLNCTSQRLKYWSYLPLYFKLVNHAPNLVMSSRKIFLLSRLHPLLHCLVLLRSLALPGCWGILQAEGVKNWLRVVEVICILAWKSPVEARLSTEEVWGLFVSTSSGSIPNSSSVSS